MSIVSDERVEELLAKEAECERLRALLLTGLALHGGVAHTYSEINWRCDARAALGIGNEQYGMGVKK